MFSTTVAIHLRRQKEIFKKLKNKRTLSSIRNSPPFQSRNVLISPTKLSKILNLEIKYLSDLREKGGGPLFLKLGYNVFYLETDVAKWLCAVLDLDKKNPFRLKPVSKLVEGRHCINKPRALFDTGKTVNYLGISKKYLATLRKINKGPKYTKKDKRFLYFRSDLAHWVRSQKKYTTTTQGYV